MWSLTEYDGRRTVFGDQFAKRSLARGLDAAGAGDHGQFGRRRGQGTSRGPISPRTRRPAHSLHPRTRCTWRTHSTPAPNTTPVMGRSDQ